MPGNCKNEGLKSHLGTIEVRGVDDCTYWFRGDQPWRMKLLETRSRVKGYFGIQMASTRGLELVA